MSENVEAISHIWNLFYLLNLNLWLCVVRLFRRAFVTAFKSTASTIRLLCFIWTAWSPERTLDLTSRYRRADHNCVCLCVLVVTLCTYSTVQYVATWCKPLQEKHFKQQPIRFAEDRNGSICHVCNLPRCHTYLHWQDRQCLSCCSAKLLN